MKTQKIAIAGSAGRMGRALLEVVSQAPDMQLSAALERTGSPYLGKDAGELIGTICDVNIVSDFTGALRGHVNLAQFAGGTNFFEQRHPIFGRRLGRSGYPLNTREVFHGEQNIDVRNLALAVQVIESVVHFCETFLEVGQYEFLEHIGRYVVCEIALVHISPVR